MTMFAASAALILTVASVLLLATAIIIGAWRDGSLKADIVWVKRYIKLQTTAIRAPRTTN